MKKLSKKDKIAYALIVLLGVIAFAISTFLLMEPVDAEAATDVTYISDGEMMSATVYDLRELSWEYWLNNTQPEVLAFYDNPENLANDIISECNYMVVMEQGFYYFFVEPFYHNSSLTGQNNIFLNYDNGYKVGVRKIDGVPSVVSVVGMYDNHSNADSTFTVMYNGGSCVVGSTYDFLVNCTDSLKDGITRNNLTYPVIADYVFDLDNYFSSVVFEQSGTLGSDVLWTLFFDMKPEIIYPSLANYYIDVSYRFVLPSLDFLQDFADFGVSAWSDDAVDLWRFNSDEKRTFDFSSSYNAPQGFIPVSDFGSNLREKWQSFYGVPFDEELFLLALRYSYPQVTALYFRELKTDGDYHLGPTCVVHSYEYYLKLSNGLPSPSVIKNVAVNTHGVPIDYIISVADVSSKNDYDDLLNRYQQEVQKNEEFEQALKDAQSEVQRAEEALKKAHEDMGFSGFLDLFDNIAKSFESASGALTSIAGAIGSVFSFLPAEITGCLYFVFVFILFVAIIKAIRG